MFEWDKNVQVMVDWIESNLTESISLDKMAEKLNYSKFYCTKQFHTKTGMKLRDYINLRRICNATLELRDTDNRILDVAIKYGYASQQAFTRAFVKAYGITPHTYRKSPKAIPLLLQKVVYNPYILGIGERCKMNKEGLKDVVVKFEKLPAHKFIGIRNINAEHYFHFWELQENFPGNDCTTACGLLESIPHSINGQVGGWYYENGKQGYLYGIQVPDNYNEDVPKGMECIDIPESLYVVFYHPPYVYNDISDSVMTKVDELAWNFNPEEHGYNWNETLNPIYQRSNPEEFGYAIFRPIK